MEIEFPWYRLGYLIPHLHADMGPYQFYKVAPKAMLLVSAQWDLQEYSGEALEAGLEGMWTSIDVLGDADIDRLVVAGVPVAATLGRARMRTVLETTQERTGAVASNDLEAQIAAFERLGVGTIGLATRWPVHLNELVTRYLEEAGVTVATTRYQGRNMAANTTAVPADDHELLLRLAREAYRADPSVEALLLPGGLGFAIVAAQTLEEELGIPVLTNMAATIWAALDGYDGELPYRPDPRWSTLFSLL